MFKKIAVVAAAVAVMGSAAQAQAQAPADQQACNKLAFDLAEKAAAKKLPESEALKVDELIGKVESACADKKFADAEAAAKEVDKAIAK